MTPIDINPHRSRENFEALLHPLIHGEVPSLEFETMHMRKDGSLYPAQLRVEHDIQTDTPVLIAFCEDITRRRAIDKALREKTEDFKALFDNARDPMSISDKHTKIALANPAYARLLGCSVEDIVGKRFIDLVPSKYRSEVRKKLADLTPDHPFSRTRQMEGINGSIKILDWTNIQQHVNGEPGKIFSMARDVTELHDAKMLAEKSAAEAEKAIEIRKVFLANMSHEVRTPLNAIMGLFQLIQMSEAPERQKKQAAVGLQASRHLLAQLINVLEISRVEANAIDIELKPEDINALAEQWLETAIATNHRLGKSVDVELFVDGVVDERYSVDARRVTQIVNNLTDNALKFTSIGRVAIGIKPIYSDEQECGRTLEITVSDTDCGIPLKQQESIFERFSQVDGAETRENGGSFLGLAISRELAD